MRRQSLPSHFRNVAAAELPIFLFAIGASFSHKIARGFSSRDVRLKNVKLHDRFYRLRGFVAPCSIVGHQSEKSAPAESGSRRIDGLTLLLASPRVALHDAPAVAVPVEIAICLS